jgi:hypothetical protein
MTCNLWRSLGSPRGSSQNCITIVEPTFKSSIDDLHVQRDATGVFKSANQNGSDWASYTKFTLCRGSFGRKKRALSRNPGQGRHRRFFSSRAFFLFFFSLSRSHFVLKASRIDVSLSSRCIIKRRAKGNKVADEIKQSTRVLQHNK